MLYFVSSNCSCCCWFSVILSVVVCLFVVAFVWFFCVVYVFLCMLCVLPCCVLVGARGCVLVFFSRVRVTRPSTTCFCRLCDFAFDPTNRQGGGFNPNQKSTFIPELSGSRNIREWSDRNREICPLFRYRILRICGEIEMRRLYWPTVTCFCGPQENCPGGQFLCRLY